MSEQPSFVCPICEAESFNPNDIVYGYCGRCHAFTGQDSLREMRRTLITIACPDCGESTLQIVFREHLLARPITSFSLAGMQPKVSAHKVLWPFVICSRPECDFEKKGKR